MRMRARLLAAALATAAPAQEALAPFDAPQVAFAALTSITSVGDFNGDGRSDAVGWYWRNEGQFTKVVVRLYFNRDSVFLNGWNTTVSITGGEDTSWDTEIAEFDGNPGKDLVFAFDGDVWVYKAELTTLYGGTVAVNMVPFSSWRESFPVQDLVVTDLDRDGRNDLVVVGTEVRAYRNTGDDFVPMGSYPLEGTRVYAEDFDGDGFDDLVVPTPGGVTMLRYRAGKLERIGDLAHGVDPSEGPMHVVGDIDNDGDADIVVFTESGQYVTLRCLAPEEFAIEPRNIGGPATDFADIDGDGDLDGVCCGGGGPGPGVNSRSSTFHISINLGNGHFAPAYTIAGLGAFRLAGAVDVDGDGSRDLIAGRAVWFNRGGFAVDPQPDVLGDVPLAPMPIYDPDRDGDPDIAVRPGEILRNDGAGNLAPSAQHLPTPPAGTSWGSGGYRGDFDGDGDADLIVTHLQGTGLQGTGFLGMRILHNAGGGGFVDGGYALPAGAAFSNGLSVGAWDRLHAVGDVDGDGDLDIVQGQPFGPAMISVWVNSGAAFTQGPKMATGEVPKRLNDLDGDGHLDLVTHGGIWFGDGQAGFARGPVFSGKVNAATDHIAIGDINGDGELDVAYLEQGGSGRLLILTNQGNRSFVEQSHRNVFTRDDQARGVDIADLDGDGHQDLVVWPGYWGNGEQAVELLFGDSSGFFPRRTTQIFDLRGPLVDVDGDGDLDGLGASVTRGVAAIAPQDGFRQQYGDASTTVTGMTPSLGATGPFHAGSTVELIVSGVPGAAPVAIGLGTAPAIQVDWPLQGLVGYVSPVAVVNLVASGTSGEPGVGRVEVPVSVPSEMAGQWVFLQTWALDSSAPLGVVQTNGLALSFKW